MSSPTLRPQAHTKQQGQTLAEFAISLPLVLLLLFGILEFGRLFQSWVTLQNAARSAVRYAVTGQYNDQKYDLDWLIPCYVTEQPMAITGFTVPQYSATGTENHTVQIYKPVNGSIQTPGQNYEDIDFNTNRALLLNDPNNNGSARRVYQTYRDPSNAVIIEKWKALDDKTLDKIITQVPSASLPEGPGKIRVVALNPDKSLYSTWYGYNGTDCTPADTDTEQYRKDMVRLASIYDEARRGAAGLALDPSLTEDGSLAKFKQFLFNYWSNPNVSQERDAWFNVMICSSRGRMYTTSETTITNNPDDPYYLNAKADEVKYVPLATVRFNTFRGPGQAPEGIAGDTYVGGACLLKEAPSALPNNYNLPWADAGSAGDRVVIVITYNHPLVTPLGLARFIRMQSSRSAVNEAFKVVNAERAVGGGGGGSQNIFNTNTPTDLPPPDTATFTPLPTATITLSPQPSASPTQTPFDCAKLFATDVQFSGINTIYVKLQNNNIDDTHYQYTKLVWPANNVLKTSPDGYAGFVSVENQVNWTGYDSKANVASITTNSNTYGDSFLEQNTANPDDVYTPGVYTMVPANGSSRWQITFLGLNKPLYQLMNLWELAGTKITLDNPSNPNSPCIIALTGPSVEPPAPPTAGPSPTPTYTPNCASLFMKISFREFMPNGDVHLIVNNQSSSTPGYLQGFTIQWKTAKDVIPTLKFGRLTVGGRNSADTPTSSNPNASGILIWEGANGGATTPPTTASKASIPEWQQSYTFPPSSARDVYLHFVGTGANSLAARGVPQSAFNGSKLIISCNPDGTGGNGNGGQNGEIQFDQELTPTPSGPPTATPLPAPTTNTVTMTAPPKPTKVPVPTLTPSLTPLATDTPKPTATNTPKPTFTPDTGCGLSGC